jgi:DNA-binding PadR family transcriptional regulator
VSTTRLLILGLVRALQPVHGYDVRRELLSWDVESWANIQPGSIYHGLRKLTEEGLLEAVATEQVGSRPARTTYRVTGTGEAEFETLLRRYWWQRQTPIDPFSAAWAFLPGLSRPEAIAALHNRARALELEAEQHEAIMAGAEKWTQYKPDHVFWQSELIAEKLRVEAAWCRRVVERIEAGQGMHAHEPLTEEMNRRWRDSLS